MYVCMYVCMWIRKGGGGCLWIEIVDTVAAVSEERQEDQFECPAYQHGHEAGEDTPHTCRDLGNAHGVST
jgi:hypothetical protein